MDARRIVLVTAITVALLVTGFGAAAKGTTAKGGGGQAENISTTGVTIRNPNNLAEITYGITGLVGPYYSFTVRADIYQDNARSLALSSVCVRLTIDGGSPIDQYVTLPWETHMIVQWTNVNYNGNYAIGSHTITVNANPSPHAITEYWPVTDPYADNVMSKPLTLLAFNSDYDHDGVPNFVEYYSGTDMIGGYQKWALIVDGGTAYGDHQADFDNAAVQAYNMLSQKGYVTNHMYALSPWSNGASGLPQNAVCTKINVQHAVQIWLPLHADGDDRVFIYMVDHGAPGGYLQVSDGSLNSYDFSGWLLNVKCYRMTIVIEACDSGGWLPDLHGSNRIVISSAAADKDAWNVPGQSIPAFSSVFFASLTSGSWINYPYAGSAFQQAYDYANSVSSPPQNAQMDMGFSTPWYP